jgi:hypothetical protein
LDVTVTKAADNTFQDVRMVPVAVNGPGNTVARTECSMDIATRYGTHRHRVCDRKLITIYQGSYGFSQDVRRFHIYGHEFGHGLGMRHSNAPCGDLAAVCRGVSTTGEPQWNTHSSPGTDSLMYSGLGSGAAFGLNLQDIGNVNAHY